MEPETRPSPSESTSASSSTATESLPHRANDSAVVLIFGGCGFIGRHLVSYLRTNDLCQRVAVIDKKPFALVHLTEREHALFKDKQFVTYLQADLMRQDHADRTATKLKAWLADMPTGIVPYVVNLMQGERWEPREHFNDILTRRCAQLAQDLGVRRFLQASTCEVYLNAKEASRSSRTVRSVNEQTPPELLTPMTKPTFDVRDVYRAQVESHRPADKRVFSSYQAEQVLDDFPELDSVILRLAPSVYGPGDRNSLITLFMLVAILHRESGKKMELPYSSVQRICSVHVRDAVRAIWFLLLHDHSSRPSKKKTQPANDNSIQLQTTASTLDGAHRSGNDLSSLSRKDVTVSRWHDDSSISQNLTGSFRKGLRCAPIYNLVDESEVGKDLPEFLTILFKANVRLLGSIKLMMMNHLGWAIQCSFLNDLYVKEWMALHRGVGSEPNLILYFDPSLLELLHDSTVIISGQKLKSAGFVLDHPRMCIDLLEEVLDVFVEMQQLPKGYQCYERIAYTKRIVLANLRTLYECTEIPLDVVRYIAHFALSSSSFMA